jgi:reactive chlorine resistance protein C
MSHHTGMRLTHHVPVPLAERVASWGRLIGLLGVVMPLLLIGALKFTAIEVEGLKPLIGETPWLSWMYSVFGAANTSYLLGVFEISTAILVAFSPWSARAAVLGGLLATVLFIGSTSIMLAVPIWEADSGGFPWLNPTGSFLIKDVALLGVSITVFGEGLARTVKTDPGRTHIRPETTGSTDYRTAISDG